MVIYIEYVLIDNIVINTLILLTCKKLSKQQTTKLKIFLSSMFGTVLALISPILPSVINLLLKPFIAVVMVLISFKFNNIKKFFVNYILFFLATFIYGGACLAILEMLGVQTGSQNSIMYEYHFPVGLILAICIVVYICAKNIFTFCFKQQSHSKLIYNLTLQDGFNTVNGLAFLDTGNQLYSNNKPVTIINYKLFNALYPNISLQSILLKKDLPLKRKSYIKINALAKYQDSMLIFEIDSLTINSKQVNNAIVGLSLNNFSLKTNSDAIISNKILGE